MIPITQNFTKEGEISYERYELLNEDNVERFVESALAEGLDMAQNIEYGPFGRDIWFYPITYGEENKDFPFGVAVLHPGFTELRIFFITRPGERPEEADLVRDFARRFELKGESKWKSLGMPIDDGDYLAYHPGE